MRNALTIDVEDYYQVSAFEPVVQFADWDRYESRVERNTYRLLDLLDRYHTKATFFVLGWIAERHPGLIRDLHARGHEVASHGYAHRRVYTQTPAQFRAETRWSKQLLEELTGQPVLGYRAASYSITTQSLWALDILQEEGFTYDSSIFPIRHDRYGIPTAQRFCHVLRARTGACFIEFPPSTVVVLGIKMPIAGGGYFRLFPYAVTRWGIRRLHHKEHHPAMVYLHPWEIDSDQPRLPGSLLTRWRHYVNVQRVEARLQRLLQDFTFGTMAQVLQDRGLLVTLPSSIASL
jgi:polysaccharide deacetylase family protein (PEP-CTERM system associated)